tara:strand:- start:1155 stop:1535 length:381 start_codon:yes stop_codon:yes gene_type:complete
MMPEIENVFEAARIGGCPFEPENKDTQAKEWLESVIRNADSAYEEAAREQMDEDEAMEYANEVADNAVEFRTYKAYTIWVQLGGYEYDSDINGDNIPMSKPELIGAVQSDLYEWANNIIMYRLRDD